MAKDSIIAKPTKSVRVMVDDASGCCASEDKAVATARPSPSGGHMQPMPMVRPAVATEATATTVMLSIGESFYCESAGFNCFVGALRSALGLADCVAAAM